jgi:outer membrane protein insertion porin family
MGASVGLGRKMNWPDDFFVLYSELGYQRYSLKNWGRSFVIDDGYSQVIDLNLTLSRSSQDQMIYPRRGSSFALSAQLTPPYSLFRGSNFWKLSEAEEMTIRSNVANRKDIKPEDIESVGNTEILDRENSVKFKFIEYHKWTFKGAWYTKLYDDFVLTAKSEFGYLGYYNESVGVSPFEKFDVGGSGMMGYNLYGTDIVALRGYPDGSLTPSSLKKGTNYYIDDGNMYVKYTMELRYPFSLNPSATIFGLVFAEGGNAWSEFRQFSPFNVKRSVGVGLRAFLPMFGMLGIDWGWGFDLPNKGYSPDEQKRGYHGPEFHFTMGQQF